MPRIDLLTAGARAHPAPKAHAAVCRAEILRYLKGPARFPKG
jgi:hypothetical protein